MKSKTEERLLMLRAAMDEAGLDAYLIYARDPHQSECSPPHWNTREWISGFTGSAGMLVITASKAALMTDGRYSIQASLQLADSGIDVHISGLPGSLKPADFIKDKLGAGARVGVDGSVMSVSDRQRMEKDLAEAEIELDIGSDLISPLWEDRPSLPQEQIFLHPVEYSGQSRSEKIEALRNEMKKKKVDHYVVSALDGVAWLFNIRGRDGVNSFVVISYALVTDSRALLFVDDAKVPEAVRTDLERDGIEILRYDQIAEELSKLTSSARVGLDPAQVSCLLRDAIPAQCHVEEGPSLIDSLKCIKNSVEISNIAKVHVKDGLAVVKFMVWLDGQLESGAVTELSAQKCLARFRAEDPDMIGLSFDTIAGYAEHGALPHYCAGPDTNLTIRTEGFFLVDSGGHYWGGTTDITRAIVCGALTEDMVRDYTLVLKGVASLSRQKFISGATGANLDVLARAGMWQCGIDFKHGTGHGVGNLLNVHEGPCGISLRAQTVLEPGMVVTIEPGIYREGEYGIRLENMVVVAEDGEGDFGTFRRFDTLTLVPFDRRAIETGLLTKSEMDWVDSYHERVYRELSPHLDEEQSDWLCKMTQPLCLS